MGTRWSARLLPPRRSDLHALRDAIQAQLDLVVAQMSTWDAQSDLSRYNRADADTWHALPAAFDTVLRCALEVAHRSGGAFDPTIGAVVGAWGFGATAGDRRVPEPAALQRARAAGDWRRLTVDDAGRWHQPGGLHLDLSAIAKGYGVDLAATALRAHGVESALVEVGGDLYGYGRKPDAQPWRVLIEAAADEEVHGDASPRALAVDGLAVATSGDRWHHFEQDGRRYGHLLDPRRGRPIAATLAAVTVVAADAMRADAWATALSALGVEAGLACAEREGLAVRFLVRHDGAVQEQLSSGFAALARG
ncbi:FAD:protein FMN transferase [Xanthomonas sontii]|uniref:FAD:protein FMN transferase n=1 Tax=Xanthomonas sontii TaxID=2650745 RepID=UPI002240A4B8|nr:FAD:protein FMN transferase [Xanthomonas sontii]MDQ7761044.1 FAD:protein FMN transferase [Xanthomonas sontii]UZK09163.1 FAD:protein FMN transferase [Xanthomonas sontii]